MSDTVWLARDVAAFLGLSYERFRKVWRDLPDFPAPFLPRRWDPAAVMAWRAARSARLVVQASAAAPAVNTSQVAAARGRLQQLRAG